MKNFRIILLIVLFPFCTGFLKAQATKNVGIGTNTPDSSAILDLNVTDNTTFQTKLGLLLPRVALTGANDAATILRPATGLIIWNTATVTGTYAVTPGFYFNKGTKETVQWQRMLSGTEAIDFGSDAGNRLAITSNSGLISTLANSKISGNFIMIGSESVGSVTPADVLHINGGNIRLSPSGTTNGEVRFGTTAPAGGYVGLKASTLTQSAAAETNHTYTLPTAAGTQGQVLGISAISNNSDVTLDWMTATMPQGTTNGQTLIWDNTNSSWNAGTVIPNATTAGQTIYWNGTAWATYPTSGNYGLNLMTPTGTGSDTFSVALAGNLKITGNTLSDGAIATKAVIFNPMAFSGLASNPGAMYFNSDTKTIKLNKTTTTQSNWVNVVTDDVYSPMPIGSIIEWGGTETNIPVGWLSCGGAEYSTTGANYTALYNIIGTKWGSGTNTFKVPNLNTPATASGVTPAYPARVYIIKYQ